LKFSYLQIKYLANCSLPV